MTIGTTIKLGSEEQSVFEEMVDGSIIAQYGGELERHDTCDRKGVFNGYRYTPLDTNSIRELLTKLWGSLLTTKAIEDTFVRLTEDGARGMAKSLLRGR